MMTLWHVARFGDLIMRGMLRFWQPNYPLFADDMSQLIKIPS
jgi:hypothetical protein